MIEPFIPQDFLCADRIDLSQKIKDFKRAGAAQLQIVFDFDRTLTVARSGAQGDITTWHILKQHLPQAGQDRYRKLFETYRTLELAGTMSAEQAIEWWSSTLNLFREYRINLQDVEEEFLSKASIRPGTKELFDLCTAQAIPTIILSAGIKDTIELWARTYGITPSIVLATSLQVDASQRVCGWDKHSLVHVLNKKEISHPELTKIRQARSHTILVGDSLNDADMAEGSAAIIRLRIHDSRPDEKTSLEAVRAQTFQEFDAMIETGSLQALHELVAYLTTPD